MNHHPDYDDLFDGMEAADEKDEGYTPRERPVDVAAYIRRQRELEEGVAERIRASYQEKAKRRAAPTTKTAPSNATKETARAATVQCRPNTGKPFPGAAPESLASTTGNQASPATGLAGAKGEFLLEWEKKGVIWTVQLFGQELQKGFKISLLRLQPWKEVEGHRVTINGPGCGFSLGTKEAEALIGALQAGVKKIKSKEFDPRKEGNFVPYQRDQK